MRKYLYFMGLGLCMDSNPGHFDFTVILAAFQMNESPFIGQPLPVPQDVL